MTDANGDDERLARADHALLVGKGEVRLAGAYREALLLPRMDVLGDRTAGHAAPVEADDVFAVVLWGGGELDRFAGCRVGELPEPGGNEVWGGHAGTPSCAPVEVSFRLRYHATVAAIAVASGVVPVPNVDWYLVVSSTNGCSNS